MTTRLRRFVVALMAVATAISVVPVSTAVAGRDAAKWLPGIQASGGIKGPALISGRLSDASGAGVTARVSAVAWPKSSALSALDAGDGVGTSPVAKAIAGHDGRFVLRVDPKVAMGRFMEPDGTVNFTLNAERDGRRTSFAFPRRLHPDLARWVDPQWTAGSGQPAVRDITLSLDGPNTFTLQRVSRATSARPDSQWPCQDSVAATYNQVIVIVGETYPGPNATADFQYLNGSSSELGVAFSANAGGGGFKASGTASSSSTSTIDWPTQPANSKTVYQTTFQYKKFGIYYWSDFDGCYFVGYEVRPTAFQGAVRSYAAASAPTANNCSRVSSVPATLTKQTANAITFSNGVSISGYIGIDLSAKTGFNSSTKIVHRFTRVGWLCGSNAAWPDAARVVGK